MQVSAHPRVDRIALKSLVDLRVVGRDTKDEVVRKESMVFV